MKEPGKEAAITRKFLKARLLRDYHTFRGFENERTHVKDLLLRTVETGESNSALIVGPRGSGKTILIGSVIYELLSVQQFTKNSVLVHLNGLVHGDDKLALKSIASQMKLENAVDGKVFGSFSENLAFLLACLKSGDRHKSKSCIFILEEFDLFCGHHNQTLLYNLFDVAQSAQAPICVLGLTCRLDVIELLEKRVKSRFSHRQIFLYAGAQEWETKLELMRTLLTLPAKPSGRDKNLNMKYLDNCEMHSLKNTFDDHAEILKDLSKSWITNWNKNVESVLTADKVAEAIQSFFDFDNLESTWKLICQEIVAKISEEAPQITEAMILGVFKKHETDDKVGLLCDLSVMEVCLIISMKHHCEIYDRDPFNFEMIFKRLQKFSNTTSTMQSTCSRQAMLKGFEYLRDVEVVASVNSKAQKEFQMYR